MMDRRVAGWLGVLIGAAALMLLSGCSGKVEFMKGNLLDEDFVDVDGGSDTSISARLLKTPTPQNPVLEFSLFKVAEGKVEIRSEFEKVKKVGKVSNSISTAMLWPLITPEYEYSTVTTSEKIRETTVLGSGSHEIPLRNQHFALRIAGSSCEISGRTDKNGTATVDLASSFPHAVHGLPILEIAAEFDGCIFSADLSEFGKKESEELLPAMQGSDWSEIRAQNHVSSEVVVSTSNPTAAGDPVVVIVSVKNCGNEDLCRLIGRTKSKIQQFDGWVVTFGKIVPGETCSRRFEMQVPRMPIAKRSIRIQFSEANGNSPEDAVVNPDFSAIAEQESKDTPPMLVVLEPREGLETTEEGCRIRGTSVDNARVNRVKILMNGNEVRCVSTRAVKSADGNNFKLDFIASTQLNSGENIIRIVAEDNALLTSEKEITVTRVEKKKK